jgi:hypothetical protein
MNFGKSSSFDKVATMMKLSRIGLARRSTNCTMQNRAAAFVEGYFQCCCGTCNKVIKIGDLAGRLKGSKANSWRQAT